MAARNFTHGAQFNRLTVTGPIFKDQTNKHWYAPVRCDCGIEKRIMCKNLISGNALSCGCIKRERKPIGNLKHGQCGTLAYRSYTAMLTRCYNPKATHYAQYGGRGIKVCQRWREGFEFFFADMGPRPTSEHSIDRWPNNDGDYELGNCRWATAEQQYNNRQASVFLKHDGKRMTIAQWALATGLPDCVIRTRLGLGWSIERALTEISVRGKNQSGLGEIVTFGGKSLTWHAWANTIGINYQTLKKRTEAGWTLQETLTVPLGMRRNN
jgi:hypothetical protein